MIRQPAVSGMFYPANAKALRQDLDAMIRPAETPLDAAAVVVPHAGYVYSGGVAGAVYGSVRLPDRFILLGPNHTGRGRPLALYPEGEWRLPLGTAAIDADLNASLLEHCPSLLPDERAHEREHSLEVQLPFLQAGKPGFRFAAICIGTSEYAALEALGHSLARAVRAAAEPVLMISSSDMNHFEPAEVGEPKDRAAIERVEAVDPAGLYRTVLERDVSMCGFAPTVAALVACRDLGCSRGTLLRYANSGDMTGDYSSVVGYAGIAILRN